MDSFEQIKNILNQKDASLVVCYSNGKIKEYYNDRIIDIKNILIQDSNALKGAIIADNVIGKVAASLLIVAGVKKVYANVMSKLAIPFLEENGVEFEYKELVDYIRNKDNTGMCPMENRYMDEKDINVIYKKVFEVPAK